MGISSLRRRGQLIPSGCVRFSSCWKTSDGHRRLLNGGDLPFAGFELQGTGRILINLRHVCDSLAMNGLAHEGA